MNLHRLRKALTGAAMVLALTLGSGIIGDSAQAQNRGRHWQADRQYNRSGLRYMQRQRARELWLERQRRERARNRNSYRYGNRGNYPNYGGYDSYGRYGGYNSAEEQRGYRNGFKEGKDDAEDRDSFNPNRHSSFRDGNPAYRRGFHRGYEQGYRQYGYSRRW